MRRTQIVSLCSAALLLGSLSFGAAAEQKLYVYTSMKESMIGGLKTAFTKKYPDIKVVYNFDSSGTLKTQIEQGAEADIFFSAAQKQMKGLDEEKYIESDTIKNLLNNEVVMIVPEQ